MELSVIFRLQNDTGYSSYEFRHHNPGVSILLSVLLGLGVLLGTTGNILTIIAVFSVKELNFGGNMFVVNLACADLCISGFVSPMNIVGVLVGEEFFLKYYFLCQLIASTCLICCICSLLTICVVSLNRFCYIVKNSYYNKLFSKTKCSVLCLLLWIVAFFLQMPNYIGWGGQTYDKKSLSCILDRMKDRSYTIFFSGPLIMTPIVVTAICYILIFNHWHKSTKKVSSLSNQNNNNKSMQLVRMLFLIFSTFVLCWAPYAGVVIADRYNQYPVAVHAIMIIMAHFNSSMNSFLYGFTNRQFRTAYFRLLGITYLQRKLGLRRTREVTDHALSTVI